MGDQSSVGDPSTFTSNGSQFGVGHDLPEVVSRQPAERLFGVKSRSRPAETSQKIAELRTDFGVVAGKSPFTALQAPQREEQQQGLVRRSFIAPLPDFDLVQTAKKLPSIHVGPVTLTAPATCVRGRETRKDARAGRRVPGAGYGYRRRHTNSSYSPGSISEWSHFTASASKPTSASRPSQSSRRNSAVMCRSCTTSTLPPLERRTKA